VKLLILAAIGACLSTPALADGVEPCRCRPVAKGHAAHVTAKHKAAAHAVAASHTRRAPLARRRAGVRTASHAVRGRHLATSETRIVDYATAGEAAGYGERYSTYDQRRDFGPRDRDGYLERGGGLSRGFDERDQGDAFEAEQRWAAEHERADRRYDSYARSSGRELRIVEQAQAPLVDEGLTLSDSFFTGVGLGPAYLDNSYGGGGRVFIVGGGSAGGFGFGGASASAFASARASASISIRGGGGRMGGGGHMGGGCNCGGHR
jgi:guanyl-specific ribonuclease Sa